MFAHRHPNGFKLRATDVLFRGNFAKGEGLRVVGLKIQTKYFQNLPLGRPPVTCRFPDDSSASFALASINATISE